MMYSKDDNIEGVAVGKCHVWVTHTGPNGNDVPLKWSEGAMAEFEVQQGEQLLAVLTSPWSRNLENRLRDARGRNSESLQIQILPSSPEMSAGVMHRSA